MMTTNEILLECQAWRERAEKAEKEIDLYAKWQIISDMDNYNLTDLFICKIDDGAGVWLYIPAYYIDGNFVKLSDGEIIQPDYFKLLTRG